MKQEKPAVIFNIEDGKISAKFQLGVNHNDEIPSYVIPGLNIFFSCANNELAIERSRSAVRFFIEYWVHEQSFKKFILELNRLGFKTANHNLALKNLLNHKTRDAKFSVDNWNIPKQYQPQEDHLEVAV